MATIRVLAIDGGGVRGILPAKVLTWLEEKTGQPCGKMFHFIAGTSNGSVLAAGLAKPRPLTAKQLLDIYVTRSGRVFHQSLWRKITTLDGLIAPKYDPTYYENLLKEELGADTKLSEVRDVELLLTTYDLYGRRPYFFKSWRARGERSARARAEAGLAGDEVEDPRTRDFPLWLAARSSSAAPTYFPPALATNYAGESFPATDGGVYANDPAMCAFASVLRLYRKELEAGDLDIQIVSIGTGLDETAITYEESKNWGKLQWAVPALDVMFDGTNKTVDYQLQEVFGASGAKAASLLALPSIQLEHSAYYRFQSNMQDPKDNPAGASTALDDASPENIAKLVVAGQALIDNNRVRLEEVVRMLEEPRDVLPIGEDAVEAAEVELV